LGSDAGVDSWIARCATDSPRHNTNEAEDSAAILDAQRAARVTLKKTNASYNAHNAVFKITSASVIGISSEI